MSRHPKGNRDDAVEWFEIMFEAKKQGITADEMREFLEKARRTIKED